MQRHEAQFIVDAPVATVWSMFHPEPPPDQVGHRVLEYPGGRMEVLQEGDQAGAGLVRTCEYRVPRYLLSRGVARSWEVVVEARLHQFSRYEGVCRPLWARMEGWHELEALDDGRTRLTFVETYDTFNPLLRRTLEAPVHRFISNDNDRLYQTILGYCGTVSREEPVGASSSARPTGPSVG